MNKLYVTQFANSFDNLTNHRHEIDSWDELVSLLKDFYAKPGYKPKKGEWGAGTKSSPLISPALYKKDTTRANDNVEYWQGGVLLTLMIIRMMNMI